jgi:hypothetical protein
MRIRLLSLLLAGVGLVMPVSARSQAPAGPAALALGGSPAGGAGVAPASAVDFFGLSHLKDFQAWRSSSNNPDPDSNDDSKRPIPGETVVLADLSGPGVVTHIWVTVAANEYGWPRLLRLRVYYDGSPVPSVDAPLGDFFAVGHGFERPVNSLLVRDSSSGRSRNSYWPMPFRRSCRITVTNEGRRRVANLYYHVDWAKLPSLPARTAYFHARYRQALPAAAGKPYEVLSVRGRGQYVGTVFSVIQDEPGWFGEGDDRFYVDGEAAPRIEGTGTEDYFNDAWSLRVADGPYAGVPVADGTDVGARMTAYRWHVADPIPFAKSLVFDFEHVGWTYNKDGSVRSASEERPDLFSSVAFWYQAGIARDQPAVPYGSARLPHGNARQVEVENAIADVKTDGGKASVQKEVFWSKDLLLFEAAGPGSKIQVPLDVPTAGRYELVAQIAHSPDYGIYTVLLDGQPIGTTGGLEHEPGANTGATGPIDAYFTETYVAEDHLLGWLTLAAGRHVITFTCTGKHANSSNYFLGIDTFVLARLGPVEESATARRARELRETGEQRLATADEVRRLNDGLRDPDSEIREAAAWAIGQVGAQAGRFQATLVAALSDPDVVVRGLAAIALRDGRQAADPAPRLAGLVARLKDDDVGVRMVAAQAIASLGPAAAPALGALIEACRRKDEHVHVQRSVADALGAIGPAARESLPDLRELGRIPRVRWSAEAAIRKIEGRVR